MKLRNLILTLFTFSFFSSISFAGIPEVEAIVKKAREHLGSEEALTAIDAVQYRGTVKLFQEEVMEGKVVLTFKKPHLQKIEFIFPDSVMESGFNGYEGYESLTSQDESGKPVKSTRSIDSEESRRNKAAAIENLSFFRPFDFNDENVSDKGLVDYEGGKAHQVDFIHRGKYVFSRFFDPETGDLYQSVLDTGVRTVESGELIVHGVRFSKQIVGYLIEQKTFEMIFDEVIVNPEIDDSEFDYPLF